MNSEIITLDNTEKLSSKTFGRVVVSQAIYSIAIDNSQSTESVISHCIDENSIRDSQVKKFIDKLVNFVAQEDDSINFVINKYIKSHRKIEDMPILLLSILKTAIAEILMDEKTDRAVLINEYINVTSNFFTKKEAGFINAVLDNYIKDINT